MTTNDEIERENREQRMGLDYALADRVMANERMRRSCADKSRVRCPGCGLMTFRAAGDAYGKHERFGVRCQMGGRSII